LRSRGWGKEEGGSGGGRRRENVQARVAARRKMIEVMAGIALQNPRKNRQGNLEGRRRKRGEEVHRQSKISSKGGRK